MKKYYYLLPAALMLAGCSANDGEQINDEPVKNEKAVTMTFTPYGMEAMTRGVTSISSVVTHLDVWIVDGDNTTAIHQSNSDADFGTVTAVLDKTKTYTLYAVGHKASGEATLTDGIVAFPDDKVTHAMVYSTTFSPGTTTELSCTMSRIVGNFRLEVTDAAPAEVTRMEIHIGQSPTRWDFANGGCNEMDRTATFPISSHTAGSVTLSTFIIAQNDAAANYTMTVTAYDSQDNVVQTRTFADVPVRNNYRTTYRGTFFIDTDMTMTFSVADWENFDVVTF